MRLYLKRYMLLLLGLGFASGFPYMLIGLSLTARLTDAGLSKSGIGLFALVTLPYAWKVLWSPALQYLPPPAFLQLGQRRGWAIFIQLLLMACTVGMALTPINMLWLLAVMALITAFCSASFDVVLDAYRVERLPDNEQAAGAVMFINGYRIGMLVAGSGTIFLSTLLPWTVVILIAALVQSIGLFFIILAKKNNKETIDTTTQLFSTKHLIDPFKSLLYRFPSKRTSLLILAIPLTYKLGDGFLSMMNYPFLTQSVGVSKELYSGIVQSAGLFIAIAGGLLGGILATRLSLFSFLVLGSVLQLVSNLGYIILHYVGASVPWLVAVIGLEELTGGIGTAAMFGLIALLCDKRFTAIHFALITSIIAMFRQFTAASSGFVADGISWPMFFIISALLAVPSLILIFVFKQPLNSLHEPNEPAYSPRPERN